MNKEEKPKVKIWIRAEGNVLSNQVLEAITSLRRRIRKELPDCECVGTVMSFDGKADITIVVTYDCNSDSVMYSKLIEPASIKSSVAATLEELVVGQIAAFANLRPMAEPSAKLPVVNISEAITDLPPSLREAVDPIGHNGLGAI